MQAANQPALKRFDSRPSIFAFSNRLNSLLMRVSSEGFHVAAEVSTLGLALRRPLVTPRFSIVPAGAARIFSKPYPVGPLIRQFSI
jgi:hypothetical protein